MVKEMNVTEDKLRIKQVKGLVRKVFEGFKIQEDDEHIKVLKKRKPIVTVVFPIHFVAVRDPNYEEEAKQIATDYERIIKKEPILHIDYSEYKA